MGTGWQPPLKNSSCLPKGLGETASFFPPWHFGAAAAGLAGEWRAGVPLCAAATEHSYRFYVGFGDVCMHRKVCVGRLLVLALGMLGWADVLYGRACVP